MNELAAKPQELEISRSGTVDVINLALPYFSLIFIGFAGGRLSPLPEQGLMWMNLFLLYVSLPALLFGITSRTPFEDSTTRRFR